MKSKLLLRFDEELKSQIKEIAKIEQRSLTSQIVKILSDYSKNYFKGDSKNGK